MLPRVSFAIQRLQKSQMCLKAAPNELLDVLRRWPGGEVKLERDGPIGRLILDRPEKNNCLSGQMMMQLRERVQEISVSSHLSIVVVEGSGRSFCSGADLGLINELATPELGSAMFNFMSDTLTALRNSSPIVIAKVHGHCLGGATEIATSCDIRLGFKDAKFGFMQAMMGIVPSWGGASWLEEAVGRSSALRLMASAALITATEAKSIGYLTEIVETSEEAEKFITSMAKFSPKVAQAQKKMLAAVRTGKEAEDELIRALWGGEDQKLAVQKQLAAVVNKK